MTKDDVAREIEALENVEHLVKTNEGTYGAAEACRKTGTGDPRHADYRVYERVGGGRRVTGCDPDQAPGYARRLNRDALAADRRRLSELRRLLQQWREARGAARPAESTRHGRIDRW